MRYCSQVVLGSDDRFEAETPYLRALELCCWVIVQSVFFNCRPAYLLGFSNRF